MNRRGALALLLVASLPLLNGCVVATTSRSGGGGGGFMLLALPILLVVLMLSMTRRISRRRTGRAGREDRRTGHETAQDGPNLAMLRAELSVLADDVLRLESQVALHAAAREDYESATHRYRVAQAALDQSGAQVDLVRVQRVVDEATYAMSRARAVVEGRTPPAPPPVLQQPGTRGEPAIDLDDDRNPVYIGSAEPFRSGWIGAGGGLFGGLLLGSMFGGAGGWITSADHYPYDDGDGDQLS